MPSRPTKLIAMQQTIPKMKWVLMVVADQSSYVFVEEAGIRPV